MAAARRLAAIMFTDTVGYTSATQTDEARTLALLRDQTSIVRPILASHHGREIKSTGDGFLVEFESALDATVCAIEIQRTLHERNSSERDSPAIRIRIGIHIGDVVHSGDDVLGDSVNIASRVEPLAEPGGVCITEPVFGQVRNKVPNQFTKMERVTLKGLRFPVEVYRVVLPWDVRETPGPTPDGTPNRIAVLPFANISPDPNDAYFSDGLTEELITVLSQLGGLRVIARTSVDPYKTAPKPIPQVGTELGVTWVLEGSVRKAGARLRIAVQLIDVRTQEHRWASTYDRELTDVFALQSEMAKQVAEALQVNLPSSDRVRLDQRAPPRADSYLEYLQGRTKLQGFAESEMRAAREHFERAIALDEKNAAAHAGLADVHRLLGSMYHHVPKPEWEAESRRHASRAIELDPNLAEAHASLGLILWDDGEFDRAMEELERAIALNPSFAWARMWYGNVLADRLRTDEALQELAFAEQLDPLSALVHAVRFNVLLYLRRWELAEDELRTLGEVEKFGILYHDCRASIAIAKGDLEDCRRSLERLAEFLPGRPELVTGWATYYACAGDHEKARELIRTVEGLPESVRPTSGIAHVYARIGDLDATFRWLDMAAESHKVGFQLWRLEPALAHVRNDPRFAAFLQKIGLA